MIAAFKSVLDSELALSFLDARFPHAASPIAATVTRPRPSHCFLFITEPPKLLCNIVAKY